MKIRIESPARKRTLLARENLADLRAAKSALEGLRVDPEDHHTTFSLSIALTHIEKAIARVWAEETRMPIAVRQLLRGRLPERTDA